MTNTKPSFIAYSVRDRDGKSSIWTRVGAAFPAKGGFTIQLDALPLGDRIVLREPKDDKAETAATDAT
jgi:hypothetical protein